MPRFDAHACTDITGFGLIGHLSAMAAASGVDVEITWDDVPLFDGVLECVAAGIVPGGIERNRESSQDAVDAQEGVTPAMLDVLFDPQTSGGLLIALPSQRAQALVEYLRQRGVTVAAIVGRVLGVGAGRVVVKTDHKRSVPVGDEAMRRDEPCGSREERSAMSECCSHGHDAASGAATPAPSSGAGCCAAGDSPARAPQPDAPRKFHEFLQAVNAPGALDAHTKQAISLALAVLAKCDPCVRAHIAKARTKGFSAAEIDEAAWLAISFGGAPLMMFYNAIRKELLG
jgi:AhpD family alkylhydroperoxidase